MALREQDVGASFYATAFAPNRLSFGVVGGGRQNDAQIAVAG